MPHYQKSHPKEFYSNHKCKILILASRLSVEHFGCSPINKYIITTFLREASCKTPLKLYTVVRLLVPSKCSNDNSCLQSQKC